MNPVNDKIIVRVNMAQKDRISVNGIEVFTALKFETNYREKSPVVAEVVQGNNEVAAGDILLCHHNMFYPPSPFFLYDDLFAVPFKPTLFAVLSKIGEIRPICGNIICERIPVETALPVAPEYQKTHIKKSLVKNGIGTRYGAGDTIFHRPHAGYDIVYVWGGKENRITKVHQDQVCGFVKNTTVL